MAAQSADNGANHNATTGSTGTYLIRGAAILGAGAEDLLIRDGVIAARGAAAGSAAGDATVVVAVIEGHPALVPLALDVGEAGLPLRIQRVERLVHSFLGARAAVDRAADLARRGIHPAVPF